MRRLFDRPLYCPKLQAKNVICYSINQNRPRCLWSAVYQLGSTTSSFQYKFWVSRKRILKIRTGDNLSHDETKMIKSLLWNGRKNSRAWFTNAVTTIVFSFLLTVSHIEKATLLELGLNFLPVESVFRSRPFWAWHDCCFEPFIAFEASTTNRCWVDYGFRYLVDVSRKKTGNGAAASNNYKRKNG